MAACSAPQRDGHDLPLDKAVRELDMRLQGCCWQGMGCRNLQVLLELGFNAALVGAAESRLTHSLRTVPRHRLRELRDLAGP